jgi:outer membrane receptor protein involved in Fe transport
LESRFTPFGGSTDLTVIDDTITSTQLGVLYDVGERATLYASRNESFVPRTGTTNAGGATVPETGTQEELGAKLDLGGRDMSLDFALFRIEKNDIFIADPTNPLAQLPIGQVVSEGFEMSIEGRPRPGLMLYAGYGCNDTETTRADFNVGNRFYDVPEHTLAAYASYEIQSGALTGLTLTGSLQYVGERFASDDNITEYPSYTRVDIGASYALNGRVQLALHVENLTEAEIYDGFGEFNVLRDDFRTVLGEVRVRY